jgi:hypothetical protein
MKKYYWLLTLTCLSLWGFSSVAVYASDAENESPTFIETTSDSESSDDVINAEPVIDIEPEASDDNELETETPDDLVPDEAEEPSNDGEEIDYTQLQQYLQEQDWEAADRETFELILTAAGPISTEEGRLDIEEWQAFSCDVLREIDDFWLNASNNQLGFSVQKQVFEESARNFSVFYNTIGWLGLFDWEVAWAYLPDSKNVEYLPEQQPNFEDPPKGHLPAMLEWETPEADRRFEAIYRCGL